MKKLEPADIIPNSEYLAVREEFRQRVMAIKEDRRVFVGPYLMFLFENRDTMLYQVQEMMRVENIRDEAAIGHEILTYNKLIPGRGQLSATLLIEIDNPTARSFKLTELLGLDQHVHLLIDNDFQVGAQFDGEQIGGDRLSSVQYLMFTMSEEARAAFLESSNVAVLTTHPACSYRHSLEPHILAALQQDLALE